jgi:N-dimethylarginine dimethylaminohydrolase
MNWGYRYLVCPPTHFGVEYEINPWMDRRVSVDRGRAQAQWESLLSVLAKAGAEVEIIEPQPGLPDMVFTANHGIVSGGTFVPARMLPPERRPEPGLAGEWMAGHGFRVEELQTDLYFEGAGDALPFRDVLVTGHGQRSDKEAWALCVEKMSWKHAPVKLVDPRYYHVDLVFCPLSNDSALIAPDGIDQSGLETLLGLVPDPVLLEPDELEAFSANSVVVGSTVIMPACSSRLELELQRRGFAPVVVDTSEFMKAGGACRCLTLALDAVRG